MKITKPYLLFLGDAPDTLAAKIAAGLLQWCIEDCVGQLRLPTCVPKLVLPELTLEQAKDRGVKTLVIGVVNRGGIIPESWLAVLNRALELGLDIASGLHTCLADIPSLLNSAAQYGGQLIETPTSSRPRIQWPVANHAAVSGC